MAIFGVSVAYLGYVSAYALASVGCLAALPRAMGVADPDTRRGLVGLVVGSGGWATLELAYLLAPTPAAKYGAYVLSLVVGLTTVGAWLYFASAYTGRSFHRAARYRRTAVAVYTAIVAVKVTNPLHGLYFRTAYVATPFPHLTIQHQTFHWIVAGLSYALVAVGFFMLYEVFLEADYDTRPLAVLVGVTGLPVVLDLIGFASRWLIDINYEPLGVAVFAVGVLYVFDAQFLAVQLTDGVDDPVIYLDDDERIREYNGRAADLLPELDGATGERFADALPGVAGVVDADDRVLELSRDGQRLYYLVSATSFSLGQVDVGRMVVLSDVTEAERQRRELARQNDQLEGFASAIRHELLNTLQVVRGRVNIAGDALEDDDVTLARDSLRTASETSERMTDIVNDLARLARHGQTVEAVERVELGAVTEDARRVADLDGLDVAVGADGELAADPARLRALLKSGLTFAAHNDADEVTVAATDEGFTITDDGDPPDRDDPAPFFQYGKAVPDGEAGLTLPNLRMLAETHGWDATIDTGYDDGTRIVVTGATVGATA